MSRTQSRGLHSEARWVSPAVAIVEGVEAREIKKISPAAFEAMTDFFTGVLAQIEHDEGMERDKKIYPMFAMCAYTIARKVLSETDRSHLSGRQMRMRIEKYVELLNSMRNKGNRGNGNDRESLMEFLKELIRRGEIKLADAPYMIDDDD